jgi:hypothetical protein
MNQVTIHISTENAAFHPEPGTELARILRELARSFERCSDGVPTRIMDENGNAVGSVELE